jgi:hypothetical protein
MAKFQQRDWLNSLDLLAPFLSLPSPSISLPVRRNYIIALMPALTLNTKCGEATYPDLRCFMVGPGVFYVSCRDRSLITRPGCQSVRRVVTDVGATLRSKQVPYEICQTPDVSWPSRRHCHSAFLLLSWTYCITTYRSFAARIPQPQRCGFS